MENLEDQKLQFEKKLKATKVKESFHGLDFAIQIAKFHC